MSALRPFSSCQRAHWPLHSPPAGRICRSIDCQALFATIYRVIRPSSPPEGRHIRDSGRRGNDCRAPVTLLQKPISISVTIPGYDHPTCTKDRSQCPSHHPARMPDAKCHLRPAPFERGRQQFDRPVPVRFARPACDHRDQRNPVNKPSLQQPYRRLRPMAEFSSHSAGPAAFLFTSSRSW